MHFAVDQVLSISRYDLANEKMLCKQKILNYKYGGKNSDFDFVPRRKSFGKWYYTVICATLCVIFSLKSKGTNVFRKKHILKSRACDQSIEASTKLFFQVIVENYLCKVLCKFLIKIESTWRREIKEQTPQLTLLYCGGTVRNSHRRCFIKKLLLKFS